MRCTHSFFEGFGFSQIFSTFSVGGPFWRQFYTRAERLEKLKEYRDLLKKELEGVEEAIRELEQQREK